MPIEAAIALGSNATSSAGTPSEALLSALNRLPSDSFRLTGVSRFFSTPAYPPGSGPDYVNAAALVQTTLAASDLLAHLHAVEAGLGRERRIRWAQRSIDLDLLWYGDSVLPDRATFHHWHGLAADRQAHEAPDCLVLPHPRLQDRAFVLIPLAEIASGWRHPVLGVTVRDMVAALPAAEKQAISAI